MHDGRVHNMILSIHTMVVYQNNGRVPNVYGLYTRWFCTHEMSTSLKIA